jgi:hypothetical protein
MMGGSKGDRLMQQPGLTTLLGGSQLTNLQASPQMTVNDPMSSIVGTADFAAALAAMDRTVTSMQSDLALMQAALRDMGGHQSLLLGYIHYLNPDNGERPDDPMNYAEWSRLQQVSEVIKVAGMVRA